MSKSYSSIFLEISGVCNGKCPYCLNGRYKEKPGSFLSPILFEKILIQLKKNELFNEKTRFGLYNWGEPFLHPQLTEIIKIANKFGISYSFSTNASVVPPIDANFIKCLNSLIFSMPGFSQNSYDRIHGFDFEVIKNNIEIISQKTRKLGYKGSLLISYHVYQFNLDEIAACREFAQKNGIIIVPQYAILNHWDHLWSYLDDTLPYTQLKEISQDLFTYKMRDITEEKTENYRCPQNDILIIDEHANVLLCCQVPKKERYFAGNLITDDFASIKKRRESNEVCSRCIERGMARYINTSLSFPKLCKEETRTGTGFYSYVKNKIALFKS